MPAKLLLISLLLTSFNLSVRASRIDTYTDTSQTAGIKSYFLMQLNLDSDPSDVQNYMSSVYFKQEFQAQTGYYALIIAQLDKDRAILMRWAISDALNGNFERSIRTFNQCMTLNGSRENKALLLAIHKLLSLIMEIKGDLKKALWHQQQAHTIAQQTAKHRDAARSLMYLGKLNSMQGNFEEADEYLIKRALPALNQLKDQEGIVLCYREIADRYLRQELFSQAKWFYLQSLEKARKTNYKDGMIAALVEIGQLKYEVGDFEEAYRDWHEAENLAIRQYSLPVLLKLKLSLAITLKKSGNIIASEKYSREFEQLKDILLNPVL